MIPNPQRWLRAQTDPVPRAPVAMEALAVFIPISPGFCHCRELEQSSGRVRALVFLHPASHSLLLTPLSFGKGIFAWQVLTDDISPEPAPSPTPPAQAGVWGSCSLQHCMKAV